MVETLRRELHRVRGTAGSYGFPEASRIAAEFEALAIQWADNPALDSGRRGPTVERFANELEALLGGASPRVASGPVPVIAASANGAGPPAPAAVQEDVPDLVLIEDDPALVDMLKYALGIAGFSFLHYATGPDALAALLTLQAGDRYPLILLDVDLPGLDGFSLHERLRVERPGVYNTVFFTGRAGEAEQLRAYRAGAIDYVAKPVSLRILLAKIPTWLDRPRNRP